MIISIMLQMNFQLFVGNGFIWIKDENRPRLIQVCGTEDFLYENNQKFRKVAESNGYGHVYMEGPGDHEWPYWDKMIQRAIQFFLNLDLQTTKLY